MTVTELHPQAQPIAEAPRELLPTTSTINLHVNEDTLVTAERFERCDGQEYVTVSFADPARPYTSGVTLFISDTDIIRLIDALHATYKSAV